MQLYILATILSSIAVVAVPSFNGGYVAPVAPTSPNILLATIPVPRSNYTALSNIVASYHRYIPSRSKVVSANVQMQTKRPTLNLDNFVQIKTISCSTTTVNAAFNTEAQAKAAFEEWSTTPNLAIILGHERDCSESVEMVSLGVNRISIAGSSLIFETTKLPASEVVDEYEIDLSHANAVSAPIKRNLFGGLEDRFTHELNKSFSYGFKHNYENTTKSVMNPAIVLLNDSYARVQCINCYTVGNTDLALKLRATPLFIRSYDFVLSGEFKVIGLN